MLALESADYMPSSGVTVTAAWADRARGAAKTTASAIRLSFIEFLLGFGCHLLAAILEAVHKCAKHEWHKYYIKREMVWNLTSLSSLQPYRV